MILQKFNTSQFDDCMAAMVEQGEVENEKILTAPVVGRHSKNLRALAAFDPLLNESTCSLPTISYNGPNEEEESCSISTNHNSFSLNQSTPNNDDILRFLSPPPTRRGVRTTTLVDMENNASTSSFADELRLIASELERLSPVPRPAAAPSPTPSKTSESSLKANRRKRLSLGSSTSFSPVNRARALQLNNLLFKNSGKKPGTSGCSIMKGAGKDHAGNTINSKKNSMLWKDVSNRTETSEPAKIGLSPWSRKATLLRASSAGASAATVATESPSTPCCPSYSRQSSPSHQAFLSSPMMQELWSLQQEQQSVASVSRSGDTAKDLFLPTLIKPRPTSFLTGTEHDAYTLRTSEMDASEWQCALPPVTDFVTAAKLCLFLETYRSKEACGDSFLQDLRGKSRLELQQFARGDRSASCFASSNVADCHRPLVEALLDCGDDFVQVQGHFMALSGGDQKAQDADACREVLILERQRQLLVVIRGTSAEQQGKFTKHPSLISLPESRNAKVFSDRLMALADLEPATFQQLDRLTEENPFCDVCFTGHSFGGALATLAAYRYAKARPELRVAALVTASPKLTGGALWSNQEPGPSGKSSAGMHGVNPFRRAVHSLPNLKVVRVELGHHVVMGTGGVGSAGGTHVGHLVRLPLSTQQRPQAFRFGEHLEHPTLAMVFASRGEKSIADYVAAYELNTDSWVKDFYRQDGAGVLGQDNEERQMV